MTENSRLEASARVALAAMLHDLGKFAECAKLPGVPADAIATHQQICCSRREQAGAIGYTHKDAAYTALAFDRIQDDLPPVIGTAASPFAGWNSREVDDSMINSAARHRWPGTFLQWIVATADRVASGFERYNQADENTGTGKNHYQARLLSLFEQTRLDASEDARRSFACRYPLKPLCPEAMFPQTAKTANRARTPRPNANIWRFGKASPKH